VRTTARNATTASVSKTGLFALLRASLPAKGTGPSKIGRGTGLIFVAVVGMLAFMSAPALAAGPPETPDVTVEAPVHATEATLHGVLNPAATAPSEAGTYRFFYKKSKTECTGESKAPASPGMALGIEHEEVSETLTGLAPDTEYTVCLVDRNGEGETLSTPVTFKTALPPEAPDTTNPAKSITATTATLEGTLNPAKAGNAGTYEFYARSQQSGTECNREHFAPEPAGTMTGASPQVVSPATVTALEPNTEYAFCLVATNAAGETTVGNAVPFKTSKAKPTVISVSAEPKAEEARLNAAVNPSNETTECHFQYGTASVGEHVVPCEQATIEGGEQGVAVTVTSLKQNTPYRYRVLVKNATGEEKGTEEKFTTAIHPEAPTGPKAEAITATTATLTGVLNPKTAGNPGSYEFLYKASAKECEGGETAGGNAAGGKEEAVEAKPALLPNTTYTVCLRAHDEAGEESALTAPITFTTLVAAPAIESESSSEVDATEARLEATIDPGNSETAYHFEYGTSAGSYEKSVPIPDAEIGAGLTAVSVNEVVTGLAPATTYHYRVVASNALPGEVDGPDQTFTTLAAQGNGSGGRGSESCPNEQLRAEQPYGLELPDCRAYEMVSPADTNGGNAVEPGETARASVSGNAIAFRSLVAYAGAVGSPIVTNFVARRGAGGWSTQSISPPEYAPKLSQFDPYSALALTPELSEGLTYSDVPLTSEAPAGYYETYLANFGTGSYQLVSNDPSLTGPGHQEEYTYGDPWAFAVVGTSTDLSHVVFIGTGKGSEALFEWVEGRVVQVGVSNNGEPMESSASGAGSPGSGGLSNSEYEDVWHAVSSDGSRIFFSSPSDEAGVNRQLYVRENAEQEQSAVGTKGECTKPAKACTVEISASERTPEDPNAPQEARFWGASADGSKVFFTDRAKLTDDATAVSSDDECAEEAGIGAVRYTCGNDLYEYDFEAPAGKRLTDLTVDSNPADKLGADVRGVVQISEDGSYVYFVADGVLGDGAQHGATQGNCLPPGEGGKPTSPAGATCNLYVSHEGGEPVFIAPLAAGDQSDWENGESEFSFASPVSNTAAVSSDGGRLAFISTRSLTGYDNEQAEPGECEQELYAGRETGRCREVYLYEAGSGGAGSLTCASCNPGGARPIGPSSLTTAIAAPKRYEEYKQHNFSENGALFFDSADALVPHDSNGRQDVYEYIDGSVYPISDVAGDYESSFLDASPSGNDVFFGTADRLVAGDPTGSNRIVVYDARVDGGFPETKAVAPCDNGDSCKAPPTPQPAIYGAPASATFSGPGNPVPATPAVVKPKSKPLTRAQELAKALKLCAKDKQKSKRAKCEKQAKQKYGPTTKKAKKPAHTNRRASR
jgi:WD40-like Beta Propeller Repeat